MTTTTIDFSAPSTLNLTVRKGRAGTLQVTVTRGGTAVNLTGAAIRYYAATSTAISKTVGHGITIDANPLLGIFTIAFAAADTAALTGPAQVAHECALKVSGGDIEILFDGTLTLEDSAFTTMS